MERAITPRRPASVEHGVDAAGRLLPHPAWPTDRAAPGELELVRRFCNSLNRENGADRFATSAGLDRWLASEGLPAVRAGRDSIERVRSVREALHELTASNRERRPATDAWLRFARAVGKASFVLQPQADGLTLVPRARSATDVFLARLALICIRAAGDGTLDRLKACAHCEWTVYDSSKNRSGRWCGVCGGRHNARMYRQRKAATTAPAGRRR